MPKQIKRKKKKKGEALTVVEHLTELRNRIITMVIVFIAAVLISYNFSEALVTDMITLVPDLNLVFISPTELLMSYIKIAVVIGLAISAPFLILQIWLYISPGLEKKSAEPLWQHYCLEQSSSSSEQYLPTSWCYL